MYSEYRFFNVRNYKIPRKRRPKFIKNARKNVLNKIITLDTETSWNHDEDNPIGWIYQFAFCVGNDVIYGRTPEEIIAFLDKIIECYELFDHNAKAIVFVHNLSYDIQYLKDFLIAADKDFCFNLITDRHKVISATYRGVIEFRCSWRLLNMSLDEAGKRYAVNNRKKTGTIDYDIIRYQHTPLTRSDWYYMIGDVICLKEIIESALKLEGDTLATLPLTSTGYVRRDARRLFRQNKKNRKRFLDTRLDIELYALCRDAFAGAMTHANREYVGRTVHGMIGHRDFRSHYPTQQRCKEFPIGRFNKIEIGISDLDRWTKDHCLLLRIMLEDLKIKDGVSMPCISAHKARSGARGLGESLRMEEDNGRVLYMDGTTVLAVTEIDLYWILNQYNIEKIAIIEAYAARKGRLPEWMIKLVDYYYFGKTEYKFKEKEAPEKEKEYYSMLTMKSKNKLNGCYGMTAQRPVRDEYVYDHEEADRWKKSEMTLEDFAEKLDKYYKSRNSFMSYQYAVWTTSHARSELLQMAELCDKYNATLYGDTDSLFYVSTPELESEFDNLNKKWYDEAVEHEYYIDFRGEKYTYHAFDMEDKCKAFRALHSKCYGYIDMDDQMHITVAGVPRKKNGITREKELGSLENLAPGFVFHKCGGIDAIYVEEKEIIHDEIGSHASSCIIVPTTKTLNTMDGKILQLFDNAIKKEENRIERNEYTLH